MLSFNEGITFGFDRYIDINIYIYGLFILDEEKDILFKWIIKGIRYFNIWSA